MRHRRSALIALTIVSGLALPAAAYAANHVVNVTGLTFTPTNLTIQVGDSVTWVNDGGAHNVVASDGSFRCANGCDGQGGNGEPASNLWSFTRTFNTAGFVGYFCEVHGTATSGMRGSVTVQTGGPPPPPPPAAGTLRFSQAAYSVNEGTASATVTVQRANGDDGAVSVQFGTSNGTATAGSDFTAASGTLTWADNDDDPKTFTVPILNDTADEPNETVNLALSSPTGGAALDNVQRTAVLTIVDNDNPPAPGTAPAAPTGLQAMAHSTSEIMLAWNDNSSNETEFRIEQRPLGGTFTQIATVPANTETFVVSGLAEATFYDFRVRAANSSGASAYSNVAGDSTFATIAPCVAGPTTLCLGAGGRFQAEVAFRTSAADPFSDGQAVSLAFAPQSGLFFFFGNSNIEMLLKVLDACTPPFNRYWVFFAATTNVEFKITVTDTQNGRTKVYHNPLGTAALPVQDTQAFATCP